MHKDSKSLQPGQQSLKLTPAGHLGKHRTVPDSLLVASATHTFPTVIDVPASTILSWCDARFQASEFVVPIPDRIALALLSSMPPVVSVDANKRSLVGMIEVTVALLRCVKGDEKVRVVYVDPDHPSANAYLPLYALLHGKRDDQLLPVLIGMSKLLNGQSPSDAQLASAVGKDRSTISRIRKRLENGA